MKRLVTGPADITGPALDDLKVWLGISGNQEDETLRDLMFAALDSCEGFTGIMPLEQLCEEPIPPSCEWQRLTTRPIQSVTQLIAVGKDGARSLVSAENFAAELNADGSARVKLNRFGSVAQIIVRFAAGLALEWQDLPAGLQRGIIHTAAHLYRSRDDLRGGGNPPPTAAASWRPWRQVHLA